MIKSFKHYVANTTY